MTKLMPIKMESDVKTELLEHEPEGAVSNENSLTGDTDGHVINQGSHGVARKITIPDPKVARGTINITVNERLSPSTCMKSSSIPGASKLNHDTDHDLLTLGEGVFLSGRFLRSNECQYVESFVGLTLSGDGVSVEVNYVLNRCDVNLRGLQELIHSAMSVTGTDVKSLLADKSSPLHFIPPSKLSLVKNTVTKGLIIAGEPEPYNPICVSHKSHETHFIAPEMKNIPHDQILINDMLVSSDLGGLGVYICDPDTGSNMILPIFTVNSTDWKQMAKNFFAILISWFGSKENFQTALLQIPCGQEAKEHVMREIKEECYQTLKEPKTVSQCPECGKIFEYNKNLFSERNKYRHHLETHKLKCKICSESFETFTQRKFHQRTHHKVYFKCTEGECKWVGATKSSLDTHIKFCHTRIECKICNKAFACVNSLGLHTAAAHKPTGVTHDCDICGKSYGSKPVLNKHKKRHQKENSLVNKWMADKEGKFNKMDSCEDKQSNLSKGRTLESKESLNPENPVETVDSQGNSSQSNEKASSTQVPAVTIQVPSQPYSAVQYVGPPQNHITVVQPLLTYLGQPVANMQDPRFYHSYITGTSHTTLPQTNSNLQQPPN